MAGKGSTQTARAREMRGVLRRWAASGLTQREFAEREGIALSTLTWWRFVLRDDAVVSSPPRRSPARESRASTPRFIEVQVSPSSPVVAPALEVVLRGGQVVRVVAGFDAATLRAIVAALESPC